MADSIDEGDVARIDQIVDPSKLNSQEIAQQLASETDPDTGGPAFPGAASDAFARKISEAREPVRQEARRTLVDQTATGTRSGDMLQAEDGTFIGSAENLDVEVESDGSVYGVNSSTGRRAKVGEVSIDRREI